MNHRILEIAAKADIVATQHVDYESARADKLAAEAQLLYAAVDAVKPALRACSGRIVTARVISGAGRTEKAAIGVPGLFLVSHGPDQGPGPKMRAPAGAWEGRDLFLLEDGSFVLVVYEGAQDTESGISEWGSDLVQLSAPDVVGAFPLASILDALARALDAQVNGGRVKRTQEILARAARLRSLATLVGSL